MTPQVMGVVNVTPDSFYAASRATTIEGALALAERHLDQGAALVDVGGESTRPGATPVDPSDEAARVVPVVEALQGRCRVSIDTRHADVARAAVAAGADVVNDVSSELAELAGELGCGYVAMHHRGIPAAGAPAPGDPGLVAEVADAVLAVGRRAKAAGATQVFVDPGIGFGKAGEDNLVLLAHLDELCRRAHDEGFFVLVGASRKRFLGSLPHGPALAAEERFEGSLAVATFAMAVGADVVRTHDVGATVQAAMLVGTQEAT